MRYLPALLLIFLLPMLAGSGDVIAQTATPKATAPTALSKRMLRKQDLEICTNQSVQQNIARRNRAEFVRKCMADRQGARKAK
jgi:hypothetical protein